MFETWVVSEILKHRMNRGESGGLSFYRDRDAVEADLIIEHPNRLTLVETKSAQTASTGLFGSANRVRRHLTHPSRPCDVFIAYGGDEIQRRSDAELIPWSDLHEVDWTT